MTPRGFQSRPKSTGWWHHIRHWTPCRSRWICHPKNIRHPPRIQQEKVFAYLFHLVSSCFIRKHAPKIIIAHVLECLRMSRQDGCVSRFLVVFYRTNRHLVVLTTRWCWRDADFLAAASTDSSFTSRPGASQDQPTVVKMVKNSGFLRLSHVSFMLVHSLIDGIIHNNP